MAAPDQKTKDFLQKIDLLIEKGLIKNYAEIVKVLEWDKTVMSAVKNGRLVVPQHIYLKFKDVFSEKLEEATKKDTPQGDVLKDKVIEQLSDSVAFLQSQIREKDAALKDMRERLHQAVNSPKWEAYLQANNALAGTLLDELLEHRARMEKRPLKELHEAADTRYDARLETLRSERR